MTGRIRRSRAEFAHALVLRGDIRSLHKARSAALHLAARQDRDGLWQGDDDGDRIRTSFLAVRVLCRLLPELPILARTAKGLRAAQAEDGSWGGRRRQRPGSGRLHPAARSSIRRARRRLPAVSPICCAARIRTAAGPAMSRRRPVASNR
ncbi:MAG: hypothetical protein WDN69_34715 [Aliidongia sp.]